jgi:hypothetical protein
MKPLECGRQNFPFAITTHEKKWQIQMDSALIA